MRTMRTPYLSRTLLLLAVCAVAVAVAVVMQMVLGRGGVSAGQAVAALLGEPERRFHLLIVNLRLPRALGAAAAGALLAVAGVLMRLVTGNPLAEPGLLGVSAGAALGVVASRAVGWTQFGVTLPGLIGALGTFALILYSSSSGQLDRVRLVLTGVIVGSVVSALTAGVLAITGLPLGAVLRWMVGSLNAVTVADLRSALIPAAVGVILMAVAGRGLGALRLPLATATTIGARPRVMGLVALAAAVALTTAAVLIAGAVAFLGLAAPEIARRLIRTTQPSLLIPSAAGVGAAILSLADVLAVRTTLAIPWSDAAVAGLPVGALVAPVCIPFILVALRGGRGKLAPRRKETAA